MNDPKKSDDLPVTQKMLNEVKHELKHEITSVSLSVRAVDQKVDSLDAKVDALEAKMDSRFEQFESKIDSKLSNMDSKFELVLSEIRKVSVSVEEQNTRNKYIMDQYASVVSRVDRHEDEVNERLNNIESAVFGRKDI